MTAENNNLNEKLSELSRSLEALHNKIDRQDQRIAELENKPAAPAQYSKSNMAPPPPPPPPPVGIKEKAAEAMTEMLRMNAHTQSQKQEAKKEIDLPTSGETPEPALPTPPVQEENIKIEEPTSLEERIGGKWFAKIGIVVLVLGVSFFLKYAFDAGWIGPTGRVIIGVFAGLALLAWGEKTIRKYFMYGQLMTGGGLAILYLSIYAALNFYALIPHAAAFAFMALVTAIGIALSLRYNAPAIIIASVLGGFATPFLVSSGTNNYVALFSYIILLDLSILVVSVFKRWHWLHLVGFVGTIAVFGTWFDTFYKPELLWPTFIFLTAFFIIYSLSALVYNVLKHELSTGIEQIITLVTGLIYFAVSYSILNPQYESVIGFFAIILAIYYFISAYAVRAMTPKDENLYNFLAFLAVGFLTIAIPTQFNSYLITVGWIIEAVLLLVLGIKLRDKTGEIIKIFGFVVFGLALARVLAIDYKLYNDSSWLFINKVFFSSILSAVGAYIVAWTFNKYKHDETKNGSLFDYKMWAIIFVLLAHILTIFIISRDLNAFHDRQRALEYKRVEIANQEIGMQYGNNSGYREKVNFELLDKMKERNEAVITIFWLIYGVALLAWAAYRRKQHYLALSTVLYALVYFQVGFKVIWVMESNLRLALAGATILFSYLGSVLIHFYVKQGGEESNFVRPQKLLIGLLLIVNIFTIVVGSQEIYRYYDKQIDILQKEINSVCTSGYNSSKFQQKIQDVGYDRTACDEVRIQKEKKENQASVVMSIYWLIYAIALIVIGFWKRNKWVRIGGVTLLIIAILKLFFVDLWNLGQLYRIIASISLGLVLLAISFMYQKYKHVFKEIIND